MIDCAIPRVVDCVQLGDLDGALVHVRAVNNMLEKSARAGAIDRAEFAQRGMRLRKALLNAPGGMRFLGLFLAEID